MPRRCAWVSPTPACARLWRLPRPAPAVCCRRCWCRCIRADRPGEEEILRALYVAAGIGAVVGYRACIAGAAGGCQAEIGTASAMAAGALTALQGRLEQVGHAVAMALKNLMGLICDPVAGLVEVPCVKRNVVGAVNAVSCADMALAGDHQPCSGGPGHRLHGETWAGAAGGVRETALGGLAATPFGQSVKEQLQSREILRRHNKNSRAKGTGIFCGSR